MPPGRDAEPQPKSPAPLLAVITREIRERRETVEKLEIAWLDALRARNLVLVRILAEHAAENRRQISMARAELARYRSRQSDASR
jgi:hypothetical protein